MSAADDVADHLDRYWDGILRRRAVHPGGLESNGLDGLDPRLALAVRRLHAADDAPAPDADFAARLRTALGLAAAATPPLVGPWGDAERTRPRRVLPGGGLPLAQVAAAAVIALAILGGRLLGFDGTAVPTVTAAPAVVETATAPSDVEADDRCRPESSNAASELPGTAGATGAVIIERSPTAPAGACQSAPRSSFPLQPGSARAR